ncbi:aldehyde dehydrogenase [Ralstonia solanacearum]|uniref:aldehyde dehydrogenase n=1 Tax=Ralstonia solanacearum TaxID=305 RepID=UPI0007D842C6|nr:aldehyde dehydrogenase [Ralstonia solanacearum]MDB0511642.1 aldehyde dehydrogenase [Ralstonia solanacearum]MDB0516235.1 aldehyde dehydrogenase [Ralstonia solanacearum]MDB0566658.1 aldehyde dehydrogenase [Ralstonia solanacearum]MDB0576191.1 aldehyde dehydrogenase [Ralstonia solanacearum]OAI59900.1 carnitine dehydratase [Ralstonia solanacearum]
MQQYPMLIDGAHAPASDGRWFETHNPYTGETWAMVARATPADVERAVEAADRAFRAGPWAELTCTQRGALLRKLGDLITRDAERLAQIEVRDNGKLLAEMRAQVNYLSQWFYYFGGLADKIEGAVIPLDKKGYFNYTRAEPLGVVAAITPWNSPLMLLAWKIAPALAAGCTVVAKPSEFTSASTLEFGKLFEEAGFPSGVFNVVTGFGADIGAALVTHPKVKKVTFTGSDATGRVINQQCAAQFKHVSLELGGKSPNIVFSDANLDDAVNGAVSGIFAATGQTCIAGSRLLLQDDIHDVFIERLVALAKTAKRGDPMQPDTQVGPVTTPAQYDKVLSYINIAQGEGAQLICGGKPAPDSGKWFVEPTIFSGVTPQMRIAQEEVFGPVLSILRFKDEDEAVAIANDSCYGLGAGVWTSDIGRAFRVPQRIEAGTVWVNTYRAVSFMSPFGGYKDSGLGRENGMAAIQSYLQTKSVWVNIGAATGNPFTIR